MCVTFFEQFRTISMWTNTPAANLKGNKTRKVKCSKRFAIFNRKKAPAAHLQRNRNEVRQSSLDFTGLHRNSKALHWIESILLIGTHQRLPRTTCPGGLLWGPMTDPPAKTDPPCLASHTPQKICSGKNVMKKKGEE